MLNCSSLKCYFCKMKFFSRVVLAIFIIFLSTPTVVSLIEKKVNVSQFYSFSEEEIQKDLKEIKSDLSFKYDFYFIDLSQIKISKNFSDNLSKHDNVSEKIFSPPPELI